MNDLAKRDTDGQMRPESILDGPDGVAVQAWQAFNAMETTKRRHFACLEILDEKKKNYNIDPTEADKQLLACLLKDHDEQVKRFTAASQQLKLANGSAHEALFVYIGAISGASSAASVKH